MQNNIDRAKLFMPFDALQGLKEEIRKREELKVNKKVLSYEQDMELDNIIRKLKKDDLIRIRYYSGLNYIETIDRIKKIDVIYNNIVLLNTIISFDDIIDIELL